MNKSGFSLEEYWRFLNEANEDNEDWIPHSTPKSVQIFVFSDPLYNPEKHWVEAVDNKIAADLMVKIQNSNKAHVELNIAKSSRKKGFGEALLKKALDSLTKPCSVKIVLTPGNREILAFAKAQGFKVENMVDLKKNLTTLEKIQVPEGYHISTIGKTELNDLVSLWNKVFGASRRLEEIESMISQGDILVDATVASNMTEAAGFCIAYLIPNHKEGCIAQLGVKEIHRRKVSERLCC